MTQEALKLALEALELCNGAETVDGVVIYTDKEIAAIKEALAQEQALQALHSENERLGLYKDAYAEQEPVAWTLLLTGEHNGLIGKAGEKFIGAPDYYQRVNVYTALPQRTWVGLTDEDISEIVRGTHNTGSFVRAIEAKLKERNT